MMMTSHQVFKTRTDPPVNPVNHLASHTHQPSPSATPQPGPRPPGLHHHATRLTRVTERPTSTAKSVTWQPFMGKHARTPTQLLPASPVGCQYFLDPGEAVDHLGDVSLGGGLLGVFQGQDQLPAGFEPTGVDLTDGISVL